jgi:hypothetical protein
MENYRSIWEDSDSGKLYFGYVKLNDEIGIVSYSMWEKLDLMPIKYNDNFKKVKRYLLGKLSFNKQVEFNIAVKSLKDVTELDKIRLLYRLNSTLPRITKKGIKP